MKIETTPEVWAVLRARHHADMQLHGTCSLECDMYTEWGLRGSDYPLMAARTTWEGTEEGSYKRINEKHEYWLFVITKEEEES